MVRYLDEEQARADGLTLDHQPELQRFVILREPDDAHASADASAGTSVEPGGEQQSAQGQAHSADIVGAAHYTLIGDDAIDFDHTLVIPPLRGTGLSELLAERALTDEIVAGRRIHASCWYIDEYLTKHPHLRSNVSGE